MGPQGPANSLALPLGLNWFGSANASGYGKTAPAAIPDIGSLSAECDFNAQQLTLVPASSTGTRTVAVVTTFQGAGYSGASSNQTYQSYGADSPIVIPLPENGMLEGTFSVQPDYGAGGTGPPPASFVISSYYVLNNANSPADNQCSVAGQVIESPAS